MKRVSKIIVVGGILALSLVALVNPYTGALLHAQQYDSNEELCLVAVNKEGAWATWDQRYSTHVAEAIRRGLTVDACRQLIGQSSSTPTTQSFAQTTNLPDENVCANALNRQRSAWDQDSIYSAYIAEATRRGLTVDSCRRLVAQPSAPQLAAQPKKTALDAPNAPLFGSEMPIATQLLIAAVILLALLGLGWLVRRSGGQVHAPPVPFAKVIEHKELGAGVVLAGLMLIISSLGSAFVYVSATTILQEIAALLIWIGCNTFWGIFIIAGEIGRRQTHIVYSDIALNLEKNIARLEKLQEQASSVNAMADAISPGQQVHAGAASVDKA